MKDEDSIDFNETAISDEEWAALLNELDEEYNKLGLDPVETVTITYNGETLEWDGNIFECTSPSPSDVTRKGTLIETLPDTEESAYNRAMKVIK